MIKNFKSFDVIFLKEEIAIGKNAKAEIPIRNNPTSLEEKAIKLFLIKINELPQTNPSTSMMPKPIHLFCCLSFSIDTKGYLYLIEIPLNEQDYSSIVAVILFDHLITQI